MGRLSALSIALVLGMATLGLAACGDDGDAELLPGGTAGEINSNLDQVRQLADEGDCAGAAEAAQAVSAQIEALGGVDAKLKEALREGATRLNEVVSDCQETEPEEETVPSIEEAEEPEAEEEKEKPEKPKPEKEEEPEEETSPSLPPQAEGKAKGQEEPAEEAPPVEAGGGTPSGGVGPGAPVEGE